MAVKTAQIVFGIGASKAADAEKSENIGPLLINAYRNRFKSIQERNGLTTFATITGSKTIDGMFECLDGTLIVSTNAKLYKVASNGTATEITGSNFAAGPCTFCEGGGYVYCAFGSYPVKINVAGATYTKMTAPWPNTVYFIAYVAKYIVCDGLVGGGVSGDLNWSPDDGTTWYLANMEQSSDALYTMLERDKEIYCWGPRSMEVNYNQGVSYEAAWAMVPGSTTSYGTLSKFAVAQVGTEFIWPTVAGNSRKIVSMDGERGISVISETIQDILDSAINMSTACYAWSFNNDGIPCYMIRLQTGASTYRTLIYDTVQKEWYEFKYYNGSSQTYFPVQSCLYWQAQGKFLIGDSQATGIVYEFTGLTDNTQPITVVLESGNYTRGVASKKKACYGVKIVCERGGTSSAYTAPTFLLQHSDQMGSYNTGRTISMGVSTDDKQITQRASNLGSYKARRWKITKSSTGAKLIIVRVEEDVEAMAS